MALVPRASCISSMYIVSLLYCASLVDLSVSFATGLDASFRAFHVRVNLPQTPLVICTAGEINLHHFVLALRAAGKDATSQFLRLRLLKILSYLIFSCSRCYLNIRDHLGSHNVDKPCYSGLRYHIG